MRERGLHWSPKLKTHLLTLTSSLSLLYDYFRSDFVPVTIMWPVGQSQLIYQALYLKSTFLLHFTLWKSLHLSNPDCFPQLSPPHNPICIIGISVLDHQLSWDLSSLRWIWICICICICIWIFILQEIQSLSLSLSPFPFSYLCERCAWALPLLCVCSLSSLQACMVES